MDWGMIFNEAGHRMRELAEQCPWKATWALVCSALSWCIGGFDATVWALVLLYLLDFGLGLTCAWRDESFSSHRFRGGIYKFLLYVVVITAANLIDLAVADTLPLVHPFRKLMVCYLALGEFLSVCSHVSVLHPGVLPKGLLDRVRDYRKGVFGSRECAEARDA